MLPSKPVRSAPLQRWRWASSCVSCSGTTTIPTNVSRLAGDTLPAMALLLTSSLSGLVSSDPRPARYINNRGFGNYFADSVLTVNSTQPQVLPILLEVGHGGKRTFELHTRRLQRSYMSKRTQTVQGARQLGAAQPAAQNHPRHPRAAAHPLQDLPHLPPESARQLQHPNLRQARAAEALQNRASPDHHGLIHTPLLLAQRRRSVSTHPHPHPLLSPPAC